MYIDDFAYPNAFNILSRSESFKDTMDMFLIQAHNDYPEYCWNDSITNRLISDYFPLQNKITTTLTKQPPDQMITSLLIKLWDHPIGACLTGYKAFLEGLTKWPEDEYEETDWESENIKSSVLEQLFNEFSHLTQNYKHRMDNLRYPAESSFVVIDNFLPLVFWGSIYRQAVRELKLSEPRSLWISHPDSLTGIRIL
jgi:hypothetical protein